MNNLRQCITRNITYSNVHLQYEINGQGVQDVYIVYGETTPAKEMKKLLKGNDVKELPTIVIETITEKRAISIEDFIKHSTLVDEKEEQEKQISEMEEK